MAASDHRKGASTDVAETGVMGFSCGTIRPNAYDVYILLVYWG